LGVLGNYQFFICGHCHNDTPGTFLADDFRCFSQTGIYLIIQFQAEELQSLRYSATGGVGILPYAAGEYKDVNSPEYCGICSNVFFTL
jgi:hypothetical protein